MATARELLEQADALMRRNRARLDDDIPVLTDSVGVVDELEPESETGPAVTATAVAIAPLAAPTLDDIPLLTDAVEEIEALSIQESVDSEGEPSDWLDIGRNEASVIGDAPDSIAMVPPVLHRRQPAATGDAERADSTFASPDEATAPGADSAENDVAEGETVLSESAEKQLAEFDPAGGSVQVESAGVPEIEPAELEPAEELSVPLGSSEIESSEIESAEIGSAEIESSEIESAEIESAEIGSAEFEQAAIEQAEIEQAEIEQAEIEQAEIEQAEIEQAEIEQAEIEQAEIEQAEIESPDFEPVERESIEAASTEIDLADADFAAPKSIAGKFVDVGPEPIELAEGEPASNAFAGGSFGIPGTTDFDLAEPEADGVEYTGAETAEEEIAKTEAAETDADDAEFADAPPDGEEFTDVYVAEVPALDAGDPGASHGLAAASPTPSAGVGEVAPIVAATTLFARGAAALLHGAKALLGVQSPSASAAIKPVLPATGSTVLPDPDVAAVPAPTAAPTAAPTPMVGAPAAVDTMPFEGMAPEAATGFTPLPTPEATHVAVVGDASAFPSGTVVVPPFAEASDGAPSPQAPAATGTAGASPAVTEAANHAAPATLAFDVAQWDAMAEEIRMQVLQRIDLFTDTGLRAQLGARLQPVVDRASADLVATINQHVGEILRAYVAEAIEREIDNWRRDH